MKRECISTVVCCFLLIGFTVNLSSVFTKADTRVMAQYNINATVVRVWTDKSIARPGDQLVVYATLNNTGGENIADMRLSYVWWDVHEAYLGQFNASQGNPPENPPYWYRGYYTSEPTSPFNWNVGEELLVTNWWMLPPELLYGWHYIIYSLNFIDDFPHDNHPFYSESMWPGLYTTYNNPAPVSSVGGVAIAVDKFSLLVPYVGLASTIIVATAATAIYVKHIKRRKEKQ